GRWSRSTTRSTAPRPAGGAGATGHRARPPPPRRPPTDRAGTARPGTARVAPPATERRRAVSLPTRLTAIAALLVAATVLVVAGGRPRRRRPGPGAHRAARAPGPAERHPPGGGRHGVGRADGRASPLGRGLGQRARAGLRRGPGLRLRPPDAATAVPHGGRD